MLQKTVWQTRREHLEYMVHDGRKLIRETHHDVLDIPAKRKLFICLFYSSTIFNQASNFYIENTFENVHNSKNSFLYHYLTLKKPDVCYLFQKSHSSHHWLFQDAKMLGDAQEETTYLWSHFFCSVFQSTERLPRKSRISNINFRLTK